MNSEEIKDLNAVVDSKIKDLIDNREKSDVNAINGLENLSISDDSGDDQLSVSSSGISVTSNGSDGSNSDSRA